MPENGIRLQELDDKIDKSFPMPQTMIKMLSALNDPSASAFELEQILKYDPNFSFKLLSLANSAYYGSPNKTTNIHVAITILGFNVIKSLVVQANMDQLFLKPDACRSLSFQELWKHTVGVAVCAKLVARRTKSGAAEDFFTMGILHDIGLLLEAQFYPEKLDTVISGLRAHGGMLTEAEQGVFATDHAQITQYLCNKWSLPSRLSETVRFHHAPLQASEEIHRSAGALYIADKIVMQAGYGFAYARNEEYDAQVLPLLGLEPVDLEILADDFKTEAGKLSALPE